MVSVFERNEFDIKSKTKCEPTRKSPFVLCVISTFCASPSVEKECEHERALFFTFSRSSPSDSRGREVNEEKLEKFTVEFRWALGKVDESQASLELGRLGIEIRSHSAIS